MLIFFVNVIYTTKRGPKAPADPWDARSLEWSIPSPPPDYNFAEIPIVEARDDWWHRKYTEDADGRLVKLPSGGSDDADEPVAVAASSTVTDVAVADAGGVAQASESVDHGDGHGIHMPSPSYYPLVLALGLPCLGLRRGVHRDPLADPRPAAPAVRHVRLGSRARDGELMEMQWRRGRIAGTPQRNRPV